MPTRKMVMKGQTILLIFGGVVMAMAVAVGLRRPEVLAVQDGPSMPVA